MNQQDDDTTRTGLWVVFATVTVLLISLIIWVLKGAGVPGSQPETAPAAPVSAAHPAHVTEDGSHPTAEDAAKAAAAAATVAAAAQAETDASAQNAAGDAADEAAGAAQAGQSASDAGTTTAPAAEAVATADEFIVFDAVQNAELSAVVHFASASAELPSDTGAEIAGVVDALKASSSRRVLVAGYHDPTGNAAFNEQLARRRAFAVRNALLAQGIPNERIILRKPEQTTGSGTNAEARRVELRLID